MAIDGPSNAYVGRVMSPPLVSIVIPAYNHAGYLAEAIQSVIAQTYPAVELIVIDDGSTDATAAVLRNFDGAFYWETQANAGQARTLEKGWSLAKGEILGYLSADDALAPEAVAEAVAALSAAPDVAVVYPDFTLIDPKSRPVRKVTAPEYAYRDMFVDVVCAPGPGAFFRRSAYLLAGPWRSTLRQMPDYDFWLRMGLFGRFSRLPRQLAFFRVHEGSQTFAQTTPERAEEPVKIIREMLQHPLLAEGIRAQGYLALAHAHLISCQLHARAGRLSHALASLRAALGQSPRTVLSGRALRMLANALFNRLGYRLLWRFRDARFH